MARQPLVGQSLLINEATRSLTNTPQAVGFLWTSDQPDAETSTWQHTTDKHPCPGGIRTHDRSRRAAVDLRLRPRGHWDRLLPIQSPFILKVKKSKAQLSNKCEMKPIWIYVFVIILYFSMVRQPLVGLGLLTVDVSRSYTPQSRGRLWTIDRPVAETCPWQYTTSTTDIHASVGFESAIPASKRPHAWDRPLVTTFLLHWVWRFSYARVF
jgi:hypothetical protein